MDDDKLRTLEFKLSEISDDLDQLIVLGEDIFGMETGLDRII